MKRNNDGNDDFEAKKFKNKLCDADKEYVESKDKKEDQVQRYFVIQEAEDMGENYSEGDSKFENSKYFFIVVFSLDSSDSLFEDSLLDWENDYDEEMEYDSDEENIESDFNNAHLCDEEDEIEFVAFVGSNNNNNENNKNND
jgi:hypothetical protein